MTFGNAVEELELGKRVARKGWNGKSMFLYLINFPGFDPCIVMHTAGNTEQPGWLANQADILAKDWVTL